MSDGNDDGEQKPPAIRLVSDNPKASAERADREIQQAKAEAEHAVTAAAATLMRVIAGGDPTSYDVRRDMLRAIVAEEKFYKLSGHWLSPWDVQKALALPTSDWDGGSDDRYREFKHQRGMERIVQGSMRLAAHWLLDEQPHFGGKYSEQVIEKGIDAVNTAFGQPPPPPRPTKEQRAADKAAKRAFGNRLKERPAPPTQQPETPILQRPTPRKGRWSPLDSRSYRDPKED